MLGLSGLAFATPLALLALISLPVLWWLLRITPPRPKLVEFPPLRLLLALRPKEETPAHTPLWLLILRMLIVALVILALAEPLLNPDRSRISSGPLVLVMDDGWAAAPRWRERMARAEALLERAEREGRPAMLLTTAAPANGEPHRIGSLQPAAELRPHLAALQPKSWATDRAGLLRALNALPAEAAPKEAEVAWIADGLAEDDSGEIAFTLAEKLRWLGDLSIIRPLEADTALAMAPPRTDSQGDTVLLRRAVGGSEIALTLRSVSDQGRVLSRTPFLFGNNQTEASVKLDLPTELRNRLARLEIEELPGIGTVRLLDDTWRRRPVGLISGGALENQQPLLADLFYLERALQPFAEIRKGNAEQLLERDIAVIVLADIGNLVGGESRRINEWLENGGVLLRFAGPRLADSSDGLLPVKLRQGSRQLGGAMSWAQPLRLGPIPETSPLYGLAISPEVTVSRQVLADPEPRLSEKTWLRLEDGTPLITGDRHGKGWLILVHTTANTLWSDMPLSGFYVDLLRRVVELSQGVGAEGEADQPRAPLAVLDGFGRADEPGAAVQPLPARLPADFKPGPRHPPGYYGRWDSRTAVNLFDDAAAHPIAQRNWPNEARLLDLSENTQETRLLPWLMTGALVLLLADWLIGLWLRGLLPRLRPHSLGKATAAMLIGLSVFGMQDAAAQQPRRPQQGNPPHSNLAEDFVQRAASDLRLAYVITGDASVDQMSRAGLFGLTEILYRRTSIEASDPIGVNLERDDISLLPFLYWPMVPNQPLLSDAALKRLDIFMKTGGMILFDTRDQGMPFAGTGASPGTEKLRQLLGKLDIPPLMTVPDDHVLTKAFYLLQDFPGRYVGGPVWVERNPGGEKDGVTSLVIGGNDWAAAWAMDDNGRPMAPTQPNTPRHREFAYRFGVNLLMYTLTGNYKADQVHIPALLERLGQ